MILKSKVIFLTGGSSGIGLECARKYVREGAKIVIAANDPEAVGEAISEAGKEHLGIVCDVSSGEAVMEAIAQTLQRFGRINVIHNNAGIAHPSKMLHETDETEWDRLVNINLKGIFNTVRYGFQALKESQGCILNTSSIVGEIGQEYHAAYTATKGGINALTKSMALDYAKFGIRVNAVAPAAVWTSMLRDWSSAQPGHSSINKYLDDIHALGYCPDGDVIADVCAFLISEEARFITGCILPVTGGAELGYRRFSSSEKP